MSGATQGRTARVIAELKHPVQQWTRGWMFAASTPERGMELGLRSGRHFWILGRAGVLGTCGSDVAVAGLAYLAPSLVEEAWQAVPADLSPGDIASAYAACAIEWGQRALPTFGEQRVGRLDQLARRVIDAAPASVGSVFAGWRALAVPDDVFGRAALSMHVLRELRGAASIIAMHAVGLTPLQAVLASPAPPPRSGPAWAEHLGWSAPFEDAAPHLQQRRVAEDLNNQILAPFFDVLDSEELDEFAHLVVDIRNSIDM